MTPLTDTEEEFALLAEIAGATCGRRIAKERAERR